MEEVVSVGPAKANYWLYSLLNIWKLIGKQDEEFSTLSFEILLLLLRHRSFWEKQSLINKADSSSRSPPRGQRKVWI